MDPFPEDIYTEPSNIDVDTLRDLGPLRGMAGVWEGNRGLDVKPKAERPKEQATGTVIHTLAIPRAQVVMAAGKASATASEFELIASNDSVNFGIRSAPFLEYAFKTVEFRIKVTINPDATWSYEEDTVMMIRGKAEAFHHTDHNHLKKVSQPTPNPMARK